MDTRQIIIDAAFRVLESKRFEKITTQDIVDEAKISRKTFYKYFPDKYALMNLYYADYVDKHIMPRYNGKNWDEALAMIFDFAAAKKEYFRNVYQTAGLESFWAFLHRYSYEFYKTVRQKNTKQKELTEEEHYVIVGMCYGGINIFKEYIASDSSLSSSEIAKVICKILPEDYCTVLE